jgi:hypothetical protein
MLSPCGELVNLWAFVGQTFLSVPGLIKEEREFVRCRMTSVNVLEKKGQAGMPVLRS